MISECKEILNIMLKNIGYSRNVERISDEIYVVNEGKSSSFIHENTIYLLQDEHTEIDMVSFKNALNIFETSKIAFHVAFISHSPYPSAKLKTAFISINTSENSLNIPASVIKQSCSRKAADIVGISDGLNGVVLENYIDSVINNKNISSYLIYDNDKVVGSGLLENIEDKFYYCCGFGILPGNRSSIKIGPRIFNALLSIPGTVKACTTLRFANIICKVNSNSKTIGYLNFVSHNSFIELIGINKKN